MVGVTGIVGQTVASKLVGLGWETFGLSRSGGSPSPEVTPVKADLSDPEGLARALDGVRPEIVAVTAWTRQETEAENIAVNGGAVRNLLAALEPAGSVRHVALMTGLKHYLGPFEAYATGVMADTPFREEEPRLDSPNFYYAQEDELFDSAAPQRLHLERAPLAHRLRLRHRQRDEHGADALGVRDDLQGARACRSCSPARRRSGTASPT